MLLISCEHPDVFKFVSKKKDRTKVTGANISVMLTDEFMNAVKFDKDFICRFPVDQSLDPSCYGDKLEYNKLVEVKDPSCSKEKVYIMKIKAKDLYNEIVDNAWDNAEPGVAFTDNIHDYSPEGVYEQYKAVASNPCGN